MFFQKKRENAVHSSLRCRYRPFYCCEDQTSTDLKVLTILLKGELEPSCINIIFLNVRQKKSASLEGTSSVQTKWLPNQRSMWQGLTKPQIYHCQKSTTVNRKVCKISLCSSYTIGFKNSFKKLNVGIIASFLYWNENKFWRSNRFFLPNGLINCATMW